MRDASERAINQSTGDKRRCGPPFERDSAGFPVWFAIHAIM